MIDARDEPFHHWVACAESTRRTGYSCWFEERDVHKAFLRILDWLESLDSGYTLLFLRLMTPQECQDYTENFYVWTKQEDEQAHNE